MGRRDATGRSAERQGVIIIHIEIHEDAGLFVATSPQFPEINVAHPDLEEIFNDLPNIIKAICRDRYGEEMIIVPAEDDIGGNAIARPWVAIPPHIANMACAH